MRRDSGTTRLLKKSSSDSGGLTAIGYVFFVVIVLSLLACVGPTGKPRPLQPASKAADTQFVLEESYWATMGGVVVHLPYGVYPAAFEDDRGVYYSAPYPIKRKPLVFGSEKLVDGGIFMETSSFGRSLGPWVYMLREDGSIETHDLPGSWASNEGSLWRIEPAGGYANAFTSQVECSDGVPNGSYLSTSTGGDRIVGAYCEGRRCGRFEIFVRSDVRVAAFPFLDNVLDGELDLWYQPQNAPDYASRHKARFQYSKGRRDGLSQYWCPNGRRRAEVLYAGGVIEHADVWNCEVKRVSGKEASLIARQLRENDERYFKVLLSTLEEAAPSCEGSKAKKKKDEPAVVLRNSFLKHNRTLREKTFS